MTERGDPALIGRSIDGKYVIEKFLGGGAMGAVYKAREPSLDRHVAIKVMHGAVAVDPQFVARFHREAKAASRLDHPNSIRIVSFGEEKDGLLYIVMEYVEGRDLYRVIHEDYPLSNEKIADVMAQALAALAVAHEKGLVHRDLKPENLMVIDTKDDDDPTKDRYLVKVCDFGIAKLTDGAADPALASAENDSSVGQRLTTHGLVVGTPEYMSPEQARGEKLDARSDIYSMGIILYQLLTGRTPFTGDSALGVVLKHVTETPVPPHEIWAGVHRRLEDVCLKAIAKEREARFQNAREMRAAIRAAIEDRPAPTEQALAPTIEMQPTPSTSPPRVASVAPTIAVAPTGSKITPLSTETAAPPPPRKGVAALAVAGVAAVAVLGVGVSYVAVTRKRVDARAPEAPSSNAQAALTIPAAPASAPAKLAAAEPSSTAAPAHDAPAPKQAVVVPHGAHAPKPAAKAPDAPPPAVSAVPPPVSAAAPAAQPASPPAVPEPKPEPSAAPPPAAPAPAPAPVPAPFNASSCRAQLGAPRSNGAVNANNLRLAGTSAQMTTCAKRLAHAPSAPASVHLDFTDNKRLRAVSCPACPSEIIACVVSAARSTASIQFNGEVTGDPAFDVPVTFVCE